MGNTRYGALAKTKNWRQVIVLLADASVSPDAVAAETLRAARHALLRLQSDPTFSYCGYILTHFAWQAKNEHLPTFLSRIGMTQVQAAGRESFVGELSKHLTAKRAEHGKVNAMSEIAESALLETVQNAISEETPLLFGPRLADVESAFRSHGTPTGFSGLAKSFFATFLKRTLGYFLSKELPNHIGLARRFETLASAAEFDRDIEKFCLESVRVLGEYSRDWYSLHTYQGRIEERDARAFLSLALEKLSKEVVREEKPR